MAVNLSIVKELVGRETSYDTDPWALPMEWRVEFEERAAILEYDGGFSREQAEEMALQEIRGRIKNLKEL